MSNSKREIKAQPGYLVIEWVEEVKDDSDLVTMDTGIVLSGRTHQSLQKEKTHKEHVVVSSSSESDIKAGDIVITSKKALMIPITVGGIDYGIMPEDEVVARLVGSAE